MNLEVEKRDKIVDLIMGGTATAVLVYLLNKWLKKPNPSNKGLRKILHHTIPPIIIKSNSFEIETESDLVTSKELMKIAEVVPLNYRPWRYIANIRNIELKYVRVLKYDEATMESITYEPIVFQNGNTLKIWIQRFRQNDSKWEWINETEPQIQVSRISPKKLEIEFDKQLSPRQNNDSNERPTKYRYSGGNGQILRFGKFKFSGYKAEDLTKKRNVVVVSFNED